MIAGGAPGHVNTYTHAAQMLVYVQVLPIIIRVCCAKCEDIPRTMSFCAGVLSKCRYYIGILRKCYKIFRRDIIMRRYGALTSLIKPSPFHIFMFVLLY